ncbi:MAG: ribosome small subunit-dependent GTPase A [Chitinophagales bacterium]|nr:ribosome small subunit-dependent GTPase A [Chitinophagales bacterium]MBP9190742.1 ribosome small subunit-dependent GTPase A [Chitinophagales bacterium]MBP9549519.1 ribosome small subunit-dependent GTPase A [Chitinophagales bacterium]MBP9703487.1 ribosome small subunit-dependent GTPase A [Chitinophagales bacterium]
MQQGRVIQSTGSWYEVMLHNSAIISCRLKGKFRLQESKFTNPIAVGDEVIVDSDEDGSSVITEILPRKNYIIREATHKTDHKHIIASNIDQVLVIAALKLPRTSTGFIDRLLLTAEVYGIAAVVVFNKYDLYNAKDKEKLFEFEYIYKQAGYTVMHTSAKDDLNILQLKDILKDKTTLIAGHSGVGKSSLINVMEPALNLRVDVISKAHGKGMHTTTFARMMPLSFGGFIIDTPGIKEFGTVDMEPEEISHYFPEFRKYLLECRFNNCVHINEEGCAVKDALENLEIAPSRYINYLSIYEEVKSKKKW